MSSDAPVKVTMSADLDVIPGRPFKGEAKAMGVKSTEDDINLLITLDEPEQVARALFKISTGLSSNPLWAVIAKHMAAANEELEALNQPPSR